jgi:hypothetical protein
MIRYYPFEGTCCLHLHGRRILCACSTLSLQAAVLPKIFYPFTGTYDVTMQKVAGTTRLLPQSMCLLLSPLWARPLSWNVPADAGFARDTATVLGVLTKRTLCILVSGPGIESLWRWDFSAPVQTGPGAQPVLWVPGSFPGVKLPGRGVNHACPSSSEVKEQVELYLCFSSGPSWLLIGRTLL